MTELRKMELGDLKYVLEIIDEHDEDDAEDAEESFENCRADDNSFENHFVIEHDNKVIGVSGFKPIPATDASYWLSWTYVKESYQRQGHGRKMLEGIIAKLKESNARKLFVKVSDYEDPEDGNIYAAALKLYKNLGFREELVIQDYYDAEENLILLSLDLKDGPAETPHIVPNEKANIYFKGLIEIAETTGAYSFVWEVDEGKSSLARFVNKLTNKSFTVTDLRIGIDTVSQQSGRKIFLSFPSNLPLIHQPLSAAGFELLGQIDNYYEDGIHELHFGFHIN